MAGYQRDDRRGRWPSSVSRAVATAVEAIRTDGELLASVSRATADEESVRVRLEVATAIFAKS